ncbi:hypothetical protein DENIT_110122 [Pseudomonas veronii]|nr:hypothetical protein DENIT_110122 [Pseudomonas veronii]
MPGDFEVNDHVSVSFLGVRASADPQCTRGGRAAIDPDTYNYDPALVAAFGLRAWPFSTARLDVTLPQVQS